MKKKTTKAQPRRSAKERAEDKAYQIALASMRQVQASYNGAVSTRMSNPWFASTRTNPFSLTNYSEVKRMRSRARNLDDNNSLAQGIANRDADNVVGSGFTLQLDSDNPQLNKQVEQDFELWARTADRNGLSWEEHQYLVYRSMRVDGDVGVVLTSDFNLQTIPSDYINSPTKADGDVFAGVRLDTSGAPVSFFIDTVDSDLKETSTEVTAQDFILLKNVIRLKQYRGITQFATSFDLFDQLDRWQQATLAAACAAACLSLFIKKTSPASALSNLPTEIVATPDGPVQVTDSSGGGKPIQSLSPGMVSYIGVDESIETVNPTNPSQSFPDNLAAMVRMTGTTWGQPLELALLDFSHVSYNSARAAIEQAKRVWRRLQTNFSNNYLSRVYRWWISKQIKAGNYRGAQLRDLYNHRFVGQGWPYLDPLKEVQAQIMAIDGGIDLQSTALSNNGLDLQTWQTKRAQEIKGATDKGIPLNHHSMSVPYKTGDGDVNTDAPPPAGYAPGTEDESGDNK